MLRKIFLLLVVLVSLAPALYAQSETDKADLKKKIQMSVRRLDMRIDKVVKDMGKMTDEKSKESSGAYKTRLEATKSLLEADLKKLPDVSAGAWKEFKDVAEEHMDNAKDDIKPVML
ncbi:MAG: hypothetical protein JNL72_09510 [Flavipsychrobacter sp.]|nr:hypothetical protein [Flavipsychrobacter sp.]